MVIFEHKKEKRKIVCYNGNSYLENRLKLLKKREIQDYTLKLCSYLYPVIENNDLIVEFNEEGEVITEWFEYVESYYGGTSLFSESLYYVIQIRKEQDEIRKENKNKVY